MQRQIAFVKELRADHDLRLGLRQRCVGQYQWLIRELRAQRLQPILIHSFLQSARLIADGCDSFRKYCVTGIEPNHERLRDNLERSLMLVTALSPHIGYDNAAKVAKKAYHEGKTLREASIELGLVNPEQFDAWVIPENMVGS